MLHLTRKPKLRLIAAVVVAAFCVSAIHTQSFALAPSSRVAGIDKKLKAAREGTDRWGVLEVFHRLLHRFRSHQASTPVVLLTERTYHVDMFDWLTKELPAIVGTEQIRQATLIHIDFHSDTAVDCSSFTTLFSTLFLLEPSLLDTKIENGAVTSANVIGKIKEANIVKEIWWIASQSTPRTIHKLVRLFFTQIRQLGEQLPATNGPVILSIDFDAFASMEEGAVSMEEVRRRIKTFLESLKKKRYRVFAIFLAHSPDYVLGGCADVIQTQLQEGLAGLYQLEQPAGEAAVYCKSPFDARRRLAANP